MLLTEIFDTLQYGEFNQLSIGGDTCDSGIRPQQYPAIITHLNMALTEIHKKQPLIEKSAIILQDESINTYFLNSAYAVSNVNSASPVKYIQDTAQDPFLDTVFKIERLEDENGCEIVIDDDRDATSLFVPTYNSIQVPFPVDGVAIGVVYRSNYPKLSSVGLIPESTDIDIPESFLAPLVYYMAHRAYAGKSAVDGVSQSDKYWVRYNAAMQEISSLDLVHRDSVSNYKLDDAGWE